MADGFLRGRYEPLEIVGAGAQGRVWRGWDHQHARPVALKERIAGDDRDDLLAEARVLLGVRPHDALPLVRDDLFDGDRYWIVADWIDGDDLSAKVARDGPLRFEQALAVLERVAAALEHLHGHRPPVCHRDVKPANIVVGERGAVLVDFGLARRGGLHYAAGTRTYLAPEIVAGAVSGPAADVYALAVTAHVLLTGALPEPGRAPDLIVVPAEHRPSVASALTAGLAIDPDRRPAPLAFVAALRAPDTPTNLPAPLSSFVGRTAEVDALGRLLDGARCVSVVGPGGVGKTRLAIESARARLRAHPSGVFVADLSGVGSDDDVAAAIRAAVGGEGADALDAAAASLGAGRTLLVLDTCEHLLDGAAATAERLLERCAALTVLATSREALRVTGERVFRLEPMDPDEAAELLAVRAPVRPDTADPSVRQLVERLDRMPLAIELAAARLDELTPTDILEGVSADLGVLSSGPRSRVRHRTIMAAIDWSHRLLSDQERACFRRLGVFAGGFREDMVAAVAGDAAAVLPQLVSCSLVARAPDAPDGAHRYRLQDVVRAFALARLDAWGERGDTVRRHQEACLDLAVRADREIGAAREQDRWTAVVEQEHANLAAACEAGGAPALGIATAAWRAWSAAGRNAECPDRIRAALATAHGLGPDARAGALQKLAGSEQELGRYDEAEAALSEALDLVDVDADPVLAGAIANGLGTLAGRLGDFDRARLWFEHALEHLPDDAFDARASASGNLASALALLGHTDESRTMLEGHLAAARERGDLLHTVTALIQLAFLEATVARGTDAERLHFEALGLMVRHGLGGHLAESMLTIALAWTVAAPADLAARAWGAAQAEIERSGFVASAHEQAAVDAEFERLRERVGDGAELERLIAEGRAWTAETLLAIGPQLPSD